MAASYSLHMAGISSTYGNPESLCDPGPPLPSNAGLLLGALGAMTSRPARDGESLLMFECWVIFVFWESLSMFECWVILSIWGDFIEV